MTIAAIPPPSKRSQTIKQPGKRRGETLAAPEFQSKVLHGKATPQEYHVYRAGLEWDLTDPIVLEGPTDFKSSARWRDRLKPYQHQVTNLITFCRRLPVTLLADDVGLGKTISAGLIISELLARGRLSKVLIVCPKLLAQQWKEELAAKFGIPAEIAIGRDLVTADPGDIGTVITTYNSARRYLDQLPKERFQMLILDEAHKLRNLHGVEKPPQVATSFKNALEERRFRFVLMLTATPIQNRLWDVYSLVDLLTIARGHENPFGSADSFAKRFIADQRQQARELKPESREEFRSIVYGYMSRTRRGDAKLYFPDRVVQMHRVEPTAAELELIKVVAKPIQKLNRLTQISILQALTSSPAALVAQLANMASKGSVSPDLVAAVKSIVERMPPSAKLTGLGTLVEQLKKENAEWRLVVFTGRRETQTAVQTFLEKLGLTVGVINGDSGERNQETIARFRANPPGYRVIVSTEAGSEGVNLQVANVLVNYDLPWNPMIVEQRIGRIQRLASIHAHVSIFNIMLRGTFEEYIVGRLMEKLQLASHALGDIEALLQGADIGEGEEDAAKGFEERILELVLAALAGRDVEEATRLSERSIQEAKAQLEKEAANIDDMLGSMDGAADAGPRAPKFPSVARSMSPRQLTLAAFPTLGAQITLRSHGLYLAEENGSREYIRFEEGTSPEIKSTLYAAGTGAFQRLVGRVIATAAHRVHDLDHDPRRQVEDIAHKWVEALGAQPKGVQIDRVHRLFNGKALLRVRATVAHDSYERLVEVGCPSEYHTISGARTQLLSPLADPIDDPGSIGLHAERLTEAVDRDDAISEFSRFYLERREEETKAAGSDERRRKKLYDDFTPRRQITLVGLDGVMHRQIEVKARYTFDSETEHESALTIIPHKTQVVGGPEMGRCAVSGRTVPKACLTQCEITSADALPHLLVKSETSGRVALPKFGATCELSGKRILSDEAERSEVTGRLIAKSLLRTSALSGKRAEPAYFGTCAFTAAEVLKTELAVSEISGEPYRKDEQMQSAVSGYTGHGQEFVLCPVTGDAIAPREAEQCEVTGSQVRSGVLEVCDLTRKRVLPSELDRCSVTGKRALNRLLVTSNVSQQRMLEDVAIQSPTGAFCAPDEAQTCLWSGRRCHPDDLRECGLTGLPIHVEFATSGPSPRLRPLTEMLDGVRHAVDETELWDDVGTKISMALKSRKCQIEAAVRSPAGGHLATCSEVRSMWGMRLRQVGAIYNIEDSSIIGRLAVGKRGPGNWVAR
jgi:ERCC4-related helicase